MLEGNGAHLHVMKQVAYEEERRQNKSGHHTGAVSFDPPSGMNT